MATWSWIVNILKQNVLICFKFHSMNSLRVTEENTKKSIHGNDPAGIRAVYEYGALPLHYYGRSILVHLWYIIKLEHSGTGVMFNGFKLKEYENCRGVGIAQSVERWATGWTAQVRFPAMQDFSHLHSVQTGSGAHPTSCPVGIGRYSPGGKAAGAWGWPLHLVLRSRMVNLYLHSPICLHGIVLS
jgi:hypothetical protein